jgi:hypothetical protein
LAKLEVLDRLLRLGKNVGEQALIHTTNKTFKLRKNDTSNSLIVMSKQTNTFVDEDPEGEASRKMISDTHMRLEAIKNYVIDLVQVMPDKSKIFEQLYDVRFNEYSNFDRVEEIGLAFEEILNSTQTNAASLLQVRFILRFVGTSILVPS